MNPIPVHLPPHLQHLKGEELHAALKQEYRVQAVAFILRQTDYTDEVANEKLDALHDPMKVVKEYLGESKAPSSSSSSQPVCTSKNKMKYGEIRKFMDAGARQYNRQKEMNEQRRKYQEYIEQQQQQEHLKQQQQQQQQQQLEQEPQEPKE